MEESKNYVIITDSGNRIFVNEKTANEVVKAITYRNASENVIQFKDCRLKDVVLVLSKVELVKETYDE